MADDDHRRAMEVMQNVAHVPPEAERGIHATRSSQPLSCVLHGSVGQGSNMGLAVTLSRAQVGIEAPAVTVEVYIAGGLPGTAIVGLPEAAVREARDRVRVAIQSSAFDYPRTRVTVNLAPAELPKNGGRFDLAIALGILAAAGQIPGQRLAQCEFLGELALSGTLRPVSGILPALLRARHDGHTVIIPRANAAEAALLGEADIRVADDLAAVCAWLCGKELDHPAATPACPDQSMPDLMDVHGQQQARRALEIAAAGGHHLLLSGPPGTGKTMLAERLPGILPPLTDDEALASCAVRSVAGINVDLASWHQRPFRAPHHTSSAVALVGGGSQPKPGEISLAHHGVLFLDELPEFDRHVLEVLREPLESGHIVISRALGKACYPARFQLVAAMNPCPCGHAGDTGYSCDCTPEQIRRYRSRLSGPLLDRIDISIEVPRVPMSDLLGGRADDTRENSHVVRRRVTAVRQLAWQRQKMPNASLSPSSLAEVCALGTADQAWLGETLERLRLSARAYHRILRVARTIADLDVNTDTIQRRHLAEALQLRRLHRQ